MPTVIYDPTGSSPANLILNEQLIPVNQPAVFPAEGPFYTADFAITGIKASDGTPTTLNLYVDYIWSPLFATRAAATGREVFSFILLTNYTEWTSLSINYRAVGGDPDNVLLGQIVAAGSFDHTNIDNWLAFQGEGLMLNPAGVDFTLKNTGVAYLFSSKLNAIATALRTPSAYLNFINTDYLSLTTTVSSLNSQMQSWQSDMLNGSFVSMTQVNAAITTALSGFAGGNSLPLAGGTMNAAANITFNGGTILGLSNLYVGDGAVASQGFVLEHASSSNVSGQAIARSTVAYSVIYNNGTLGVGATLTNNGTLATLSVDGHSVVSGEEVLIMDQADPIQNGHYVVTNAGDGATAWVLTRTANMDNHALGPVVKAGAIIIVTGGTVPNAGTSWTITSQGTGAGGAIVLGTDPIVFGPFNISINLSNYVTNPALTTALADYATHAELAATSGSSVPPGTILPFTGDAIPVGFLQCPTSPTDMVTSANVDLFGAIGGNWQNSSWLPEDLVNYTSTRLSDGRIMIMGGTIGGVGSRAVYFGTISGDNITWVKSVNVLPLALSEAAAVTFANGKVWLFGGWSGDIDRPMFPVPTFNSTSFVGVPYSYLMTISGDTFTYLNVEPLRLKNSTGFKAFRGHGAAVINHAGEERVMIVGGFTSIVGTVAPVAEVQLVTLNQTTRLHTIGDATVLPYPISKPKVISLESNKVCVIGGVSTNRALIESTNCYFGQLSTSVGNAAITWTSRASVPLASIEQQVIKLNDGRLLALSCGKTPNGQPASYFGSFTPTTYAALTWTANVNPVPSFSGQIMLTQLTGGKVVLINRKVYLGTVSPTAITWTSDNNSTVFGLPWFPVGYVPVQNPTNVGRTTMGDLMSHTHVDLNHLTFNELSLQSNFSWGASTSNISTFIVDKSANLPAGQGVKFIVKT